MSHTIILSKPLTAEQRRRACWSLILAFWFPQSFVDALVLQIHCTMWIKNCGVAEPTEARACSLCQAGTYRTGSGLLSNMTSVAKIMSQSLDPHTICLPECTPWLCWWNDAIAKSTCFTGRAILQLETVMHKSAQCLCLSTCSIESVHD